MPLTALELWNASKLAPSDLGNIKDENGDFVIPIEANEAEQFEAAVAWIATKVLPGAAAEVGVPVRAALGDYSTVFDTAGLTAKFGAFAVELIPLWDFAQTSYGRSELNKQVDSNNDSYDKDSDQDRIQGNQRLQKLLEALVAWKQAQSSSGGESGSANGGSWNQVTSTIPITVVR